MGTRGKPHSNRNSRRPLQWVMADSKPQFLDTRRSSTLCRMSSSYRYAENAQGSPNPQPTAR